MRSPPPNDRDKPYCPPPAQVPPKKPVDQPPVPIPQLPPTILNPPGLPPVSSLVRGTPRGDVFPGRPDPGVAPVDGRTLALRWLGRYLTQIQDARAGAVGGDPNYFRVPPENFFVERPGPEQELPFPSIVVVGEDATELPIGLVPVPDETTLHRFGWGTVVVPQAEHSENIKLEIWSSELPELRGVVAGIQHALSPTEQRRGVLVAMPDYLDQTVRFTLKKTEYPDEANAVRNWRRADVTVLMEFQVARLYNAVTMTPLLTVDMGLVNVPRPPPYSPEFDATLVAWFDADHVTMGTGALIAGATNLAAGRPNATQADPTFQPSLAFDSTLRRNVVAFDGAQYLAALGLGPLPGDPNAPFTMVLIGQTLAPQIHLGSLALTWGSEVPGDASFASLFLNQTPVPYGEYGCPYFNGFYFGTDAHTFTSWFFPNLQQQMVVAVYDGRFIQTYIDQVPGPNTDTGGETIAGMTSLVLGGGSPPLVAVGAQNYWVGNMVAALFFEGAKTGQDLLDLQAWLVAKYGVL